MSTVAEAFPWLAMNLALFPLGIFSYDSPVQLIHSVYICALWMPHPSLSQTLLMGLTHKLLSEYVEGRHPPSSSTSHPSLAFPSRPSSIPLLTHSLMQPLSPHWVHPSWTFPAPGHDSRCWDGYEEILLCPGLSSVWYMSVLLHSRSSITVVQGGLVGRPWTLWAWSGILVLPFQHCVNLEQCNFPKPQIPDLEIRVPIF